MIRLIKIILLAFFLVSCKQVKKDSIEKQTVSVSKLETKTISSSNISNVSTYSYFTSYRINKSYEASDIEVINKFKKLKFDFKGKTFVDIKNIGSEELYKNRIDAKEFFDDDFLFSFYSQSLKVKLNIQLPKSIDYVKNKNSHSKSSVLRGIFETGFFVGENFIFESEGNVIVFILENSVKKEQTLQVSSSDLPYVKKIDVKNIEYLIYEKSLSNIDEWLCGHSKLRYLPVTNKNRVELVLIPMDCADFKYRFFLLSINSNKVISSLYVEGEWDEPGDDSYKEVTNFEINENFELKVITKSIENDVQIKVKEELFSINDKGDFVKK